MCVCVSFEVGDQMRNVMSRAERDGESAKSGGVV